MLCVQLYRRMGGPQYFDNQSTPSVYSSSRSNASNISKISDTPDSIKKSELKRRLLDEVH